MSRYRVTREDGWKRLAAISATRPERVTLVWMGYGSREDGAREAKMLQAMRGKGKGKKNKFIQREQKA